MGNRDAILPFRLIGFQTHPVQATRSDQYPGEKLSRENFGIIYPTEDIALGYSRYSGFYDQQLTPASDPSRPIEGTTGLGQQRIRDNVEKAVGQDIL